MNGFNRFKLGTLSPTDRNDIETDALALYQPNPSILVPTLQEIWDNSDESVPSTNFPCGINAGYPYYSSPVTRIYQDMNPAVHATDPWYTTAEETISGGCTLGMGTSVNTTVELGVIYSWWLMNNDTWQLATNTKLRYNGSPYPNSSDPFGDTLGCTSGPVYDSRVANEGYDPYLALSPDGYGRCVPKFAYWDHGWQPIVTIPTNVKAQFVQQYVRLILIDPEGVDDRHLARFVHCTGADSRELDGTVYGDVGIGRWKRVTNSWEACTMLTGGHFANVSEFELNPPPFSLVP